MFQRWIAQQSVVNRAVRQRPESSSIGNDLENRTKHRLLGFADRCTAFAAVDFKRIGINGRLIASVFRQCPMGFLWVGVDQLFSQLLGERLVTLSVVLSQQNDEFVDVVCSPDRFDATGNRSKSRQFCRRVSSMTAEDVIVHRDDKRFTNAVPLDAFGECDDFRISRIDGPIQAVVFGRLVNFSERFVENSGMFKFRDVLSIPLAAGYTARAAVSRPRLACSPGGFFTRGHASPPIR